MGTYEQLIYLLWDYLIIFLYVQGVYFMTPEIEGPPTEEAQQHRIALRHQQTSAFLPRRMESLPCGAKHQGDAPALQGKALH